MAVCPECEASLDVEDQEIEEGQLLECPECGAKFEVVSTNPLELELIEKDEDQEEDGS
jgi:alpha-aminoadipate carrier protein LysW